MFRRITCLRVSPFSILRDTSVSLCQTKPRTPASGTRNAASTESNPVRSSNAFHGRSARSGPAVAQMRISLHTSPWRSSELTFVLIW